MDTKKYLNWIWSRTGKQNTPAEMLDLINIAQNEIFSYNTYFNRKKPISSCTLDTIDGILQYTIPDSSIRQISRLYYYNSGDGDIGYGRKSSEYNIDISAQVDESLSPDGNVVVYFEENQGTTTGKIFYDAYVWPHNGQLTSTSVKLSVPEKIQTKLLFYLVSEMLEVDKDGRSIFNESQVNKFYKDFFTFANQGVKTELSTPRILGV